MRVHISGIMTVEHEAMPFDRVYHDVESFDIVGNITLIKTPHGVFELNISIGKLEVTP